MNYPRRAGRMNQPRHARPLGRTDELDWSHAYLE